MMHRRRWMSVVGPLVVIALVAAACGDGDDATTTSTPAGTTPPTTTGEATTPEDFQIGMILVGPQNDAGWSQAHYEAGVYVMDQLGLPVANLIVLDKVNSADRPETTIADVVTDMVEQGADLVFATSDDMRDGIEEAAALHPDVPMIWSSGDNAWPEGKGYRADLANLGNIMGRMEYGKMIAGCAAALSTDSGRVSYLGPLINDETRRLVNSAFLGARYCWEQYREGDAADLAFEVKWIGFWFNIPGFTLDPTQVTNEFLAAGSDAIISGIDTTEALVVAGQSQDAGDAVWAIPYDFDEACSVAPQACLGVPYFNWGPSYVDVAQSVIDGSFTATWQWLGPDWTDITNEDTSAVGWVNGDALAEDAAASLAAFIGDLGSGAVDLYTGPLNWQDGSAFLADGETATDLQIWYAEQLLEGVEGASAAE